MTDKSILYYAITKAKQNGFSYPQVLGFPSIPELAETLISDGRWFRFIFSHDFAKAFWGDDFVTDSHFSGYENIPRWQYFLKRLVLKKEPLKYLEQFIKE